MQLLVYYNRKELLTESMSLTYPLEEEGMYDVSSSTDTVQSPLPFFSPLLSSLRPSPLQYSSARL